MAHASPCTPIESIGLCLELTLFLGAKKNPKVASLGSGINKQ
jgi:hypothetical protein